jgi:hypothetical protein
MCTVAAYVCAAFNAPCKAKATQIWCGNKLVALNARGAGAFHARILEAVLICGCGPSWKLARKHLDVRT